MKQRQQRAQPPRVAARVQHPQLHRLEAEAAAEEEDVVTAAVEAEDMADVAEATEAILQQEASDQCSKGTLTA